MDDEGGEPIYIQAQGLRRGRFPQKSAITLIILIKNINVFWEVFNIQGGALAAILAEIAAKAPPTKVSKQIPWDQEFWPQCN